MPLLQERWPAVARVLARAAANSADAAQLLNEIARTDLSAATLEEPDALSLPVVRTLTASRQRNLIRYWIADAGFLVPSAEHLEQILEQINHPSQTGHACVDWPDVEVRRYRDRLTVRARTVDVDRALDLRWQPPQSVHIPDTGWILRAEVVQGRGLSQAKLAHAALRVRRRRGGESCRLAGHTHSTTLKKLLQEQNVPPWERERLPLIYVDDELAAIGDRWVCAPFAAGADEPGWKIVIEKPR
jgi:tRNA(Ile)-lysidine synthase